MILLMDKILHKGGCTKIALLNIKNNTRTPYDVQDFVNQL